MIRCFFAQLCCLALGCLLLTPGTVMAAEEPPLRILVEPNRPPFSGRAPSGVPVGFDVSIAQALCAEMNRSCLITTRPLFSALEELAASNADLIVAGIVPTPELRDRFDFSDRYYQTTSVFVAAEGTDYLSGKRIGALTGSQQYRYASRKDQTFASVHNSSSVQSLWAMLASRAVDAVLMDNLLAYGFLLSPQGRSFDFAGPLLSDKDLAGSHHIALPKGQHALREAVNQALLALRRNGTFIAISYRYFKIDID